MTEMIVKRPMAMMGKILLVSCPPGTPICDINGKMLGFVDNRKPVINGDTCYLSTDDYKAAKASAQIVSPAVPYN